MWDKERINPAFEIGSTVTNSSGYFDYNSTDFSEHFLDLTKFMQPLTNKDS